MKKIAIGVIGMGGAGRAHAARFARHRRVSKVIGCDRRVVAEAAVPMAPDVNALLSEVDAVSICTPDDTHCRYIEQCLEAGRHVLVEKPMVTSSAESERVRAAVEARPECVFAVHHQMRCVGAFRRARGLIERGALGAIAHIEANYWHDMRRRWTRFDNWRAQGRGQSVIFGGACHPLDLVLDLVDEPVVAHETYVNHNAFADWPSAYTAATTMLQFASGVTAKVHASFGAVFPQRNDLIVLGDRGTFVDGVVYDGARFTDGNTYGETWKGVRMRRGRAFRECVLNPLAKVVTAAAARTPMFRNNPFSVYHHEHACRALIDNFIDAITTGSPPLVGFADGRRVVELCEAIERQALGADETTAPRPTLGRAA